MNNKHIEPALVVVIPVYEDRDAAKLLFKEISTKIKCAVYIVAVDDGSVRNPINIEVIKNTGLNGVVIKLKRNVGHQRAIAIGLNYVVDELNNQSQVVIMDSDGEDLPETINNLLEALSDSNTDIAVATRKGRVETLKFRVFYVVYKSIFKLLVGKSINFGNFMALKMSAVKRLTSMQELWLHIAGCVISSKLRITSCPLNRGGRYAGQSKMNFVSLALHGFKGVMIFAEDVLVRVGVMCSVIAMTTIIAGIVAFSLKILGFATPGWFSVALGILLLVFLQTGILALISLMLTGVMKNGSIATVDYKEFIGEIQTINE
jgi:polyisoprenyl-phosphate glycosyltransferase